MADEPNVHIEDDTEEEPRCLLCDLLHEVARTDVGRHLLNARREFLLALRAGLDARIRRIDEATEEARRIEVE